MDGYAIATCKPQKAPVFLEGCITAFLFCSGLPPCCNFDRRQVMGAGDKGPQSVLGNAAQEGRTPTAWNVYTGLEEGDLKQGRHDVCQFPRVQTLHECSELGCSYSCFRPVCPQGPRGSEST